MLRDKEPLLIRTKLWQIEYLILDERSSWRQGSKGIHKSYQRYDFFHEFEFVYHFLTSKLSRFMEILSRTAKLSVK